MGLISRVSSRTYRKQNKIKLKSKPKMADPRTKQLRIQAGVVKRTAKEYNFYLKEQSELENSISTMKSAGDDEYMIGKKNDLLLETKTTLEDTKRRITAAVDKLTDLVNDSGAELSESKEFQAAVESLRFAQELDLKNE